MTYLNARAKNIGNDQGDVYKYFKNELSNLVQHNGGDHYFNWKTFECTEQTAPHKTIISTGRLLNALSRQHLIQWEQKHILDSQLKTLISHIWRNHLFPYY